MADVSYTNGRSAVTIRRGSDTTLGKGEAGNVKAVCGTIELAASSSADTIYMGRVPSNARFLPVCLIHNDDLATTGSPTLDIGLASVDSNVTSDPDAINNGIALSSATNTTILHADTTNAGLPAWDLVNGQSTDPGGELDIYGTVKDAATTATGTLTWNIFYTLD